jgi:hypothetical protein
MPTCLHFRALGNTAARSFLLSDLAGWGGVGPLPTKSALPYWS